MNSSSYKIPEVILQKLVVENILNDNEKKK